MTDSIHTRTEPVAWMYEGAEGAWVTLRQTKDGLCGLTETPLYTAPQGSEREAIVAWLTQRVGVVVRMILMAGMPGVSRTQKVKDKAFADGYGKAIADLKNAIERGDHLPPPPTDNGGE